MIQYSGFNRDGTILLLQKGDDSLTESIFGTSSKSIISSIDYKVEDIKRIVDIKLFPGRYVSDANILVMNDQGVCYGYGDNRMKELGLPSLTWYNTFKRIEGAIADKAITKISTGSTVSAYVSTEGEVYTTGRTSYGVLGVLGVGVDLGRFVPLTKVALSKALNVFFGFQSTYFLTE